MRARHWLHSSLLFTSLLLAAPLWATTYTAASCSASDVQAAINLATDGDTVLVPNADCPSGTPATWTTAVTATKGIYFNAQGSYITFGSGGSLSITGDSAHGTLVENFNFASTTANCDATLNITSSTAPMRFTGNTWVDSSGQAILVCINGLGTLLVDHNTLTTDGAASEVIHILGLGAGNDNWTDDVTPGSPHMVYIETNTFNNNSGTNAAGSNADESFYGAEFVFRDNTLNNEANDAHDGDGARWYEIYGNTYTFATTGGQACYGYGTQMRGGSGLFYGNHLSGTPGCSNPVPGTTFGPDCPSSDTCTGTWPVAKQVGRGINETTYSPAYAWGNDAGIPIGASGSQSLVLVGTAPTDAANCSGHAGNVCDAVSVATEPTLERCQTAADVTAGCPVSYTYAAFTYPYPLSGDGLPNPSGTSYSLTVTATNGSVSGTNCATGNYASGASIGACTATPNAGYSFTGWSGTGSASCTGTGACGPFSITANSTLTASFASLAQSPGAPQMLMGMVTRQ